MAIVVNKPLPEFEANATGGLRVTNSSHTGQTLVLFFYPKDSTPGCTTEASRISSPAPKTGLGKRLELGKILEVWKFVPHFCISFASNTQIHYERDWIFGSFCRTSA